MAPRYRIPKKTKRIKNERPLEKLRTEESPAQAQRTGHRIREMSRQDVSPRTSRTWPHVADPAGVSLYTRTKPCAFPYKLFSPCAPPAFLTRRAHGCPAQTWHTGPGHLPFLWRASLHSCSPHVRDVWIRQVANLARTPSLATAGRCWTCTTCEFDTSRTSHTRCDHLCSNTSRTSRPSCACAPGKGPRTSLTSPRVTTCAATRRGRQGRAAPAHLGNGHARRSPRHV